MTTAAREAILDAALRLFLERGYDGTSLTRILATVPYSRGAVYHHFASKEALLDAVVERFLAAPVDRTTKAVTDTAPAATLAHQLVEDYVAALTTASAHATPASSYAFLCSVAPRATETIRRTQERAVRGLEDALRRDGYIDPGGAAQDLVALIEGHGMLMVLRGEGLVAAPLHDAVDRLLSREGRRPPS